MLIFINLTNHTIHMNDEVPSTNRKALLINLDPKKYGVLAEIGAGQEVARYFFQVGGAAGTVAMSISAYDMAFSDVVYGKSKRYVSSDRLVQMLSHEYNKLQIVLLKRSVRLLLFLRLQIQYLR